MTYRFVRRLSEGGFSEVFAVEDLESALPERLVLKRLNAEMSGRPSVREAFASEAKLLRELRHPNVVTFRRCYFDGKGRVCLLMEEVAGEPLDAWARRHAATPEAVLGVFEDVLRAVDYLHHRPHPYLHLDLKPDNIVVTSAGGRAKPVLIDFGIARRSGDSGLRAYTPPYAAPEQRQKDRRLDPATDVHALGQILAELLALLDLPADTAAALAAVAERARSPARASRFADAGQMGLAFRQARRAAPAPVPTPVLQTLRAQRWLGPAVAAGAAAVLLVAGVAPLLSGRDGPTPEVVETSGLTAPETPVSDEFAELVEQALTATRDHRWRDAELSFRSAQGLVDRLPGDAEERLQMTLELEDLRRQIELRHQGALVVE